MEFVSSEGRFPAIRAVLDYAAGHADSKPYDWVPEAREMLELVKSLEAENQALRDAKTGDATHILERIKSFTAMLDRKHFYDFYGVMTALSSPACGDHLMVSGRLLNLKKIIRRLRITVMSPRFNVDYAPAYTRQEAQEDLDRLTDAYPSLGRTEERQSVAKAIGALQIVVEALAATPDSAVSEHSEIRREA